MRELARQISSIIGVDTHVHSEVKRFLPDEVPLTVLYGALGADICAAWRAGSNEQCRRALEVVDQHLSDQGSSQELQEVLATGLLEGLWNPLAENERRSIFSLMGPSSQQYIRAWDQFWGIDPSGYGG